MKLKNKKICKIKNCNKLVRTICNNGLGCFKDNIKLIKKAIKYLKKKK